MSAGKSLWPLGLAWQAGSLPACSQVQPHMKKTRRVLSSESGGRCCTQVHEQTLAGGENAPARPGPGEPSTSPQFCPSLLALLSLGSYYYFLNLSCSSRRPVVPFIPSLQISHLRPQQVPGGRLCPLVLSRRSPRGRVLGWVPLCASGRSWLLEEPGDRGDMGQGLGQLSFQQGLTGRPLVSGQSSWSSW